MSHLRGFSTPPIEQIPATAVEISTDLIRRFSIAKTAPDFVVQTSSVPFKIQTLWGKLHFLSLPPFLLTFMSKTPWSTRAMLTGIYWILKPSSTGAHLHWFWETAPRSEQSPKVPTIKNASDNALLYQSMKSGFCYIQESVGGNSSVKDRCRHRVKPALLQSRVPAVERSLNLCSANQKNTICLINMWGRASVPSVWPQSNCFCV